MIKFKKYIKRRYIKRKPGKYDYLLRNSIKEKAGIYGIKNKITNRWYIGSTNNIRKRFLSHIGALNDNKHTNFLLQEDTNINGLDSLIFVVFKYFKNGKEERYKLGAEEKIIFLFIKHKLLLYNRKNPKNNKGIRVYNNCTTPISINSIAKVAYIIKDIDKKAVYNGVTNLKDFYERNKYFGSPSDAIFNKLLSTITNNNKIAIYYPKKYSKERAWSIEIDYTACPLALIEQKIKKLNTAVSYRKKYTTYKRTITWEVLNVKTKEIFIFNNLSKFCKDHLLNYNQFQRYANNENRTYLDIWKLKKI